MAKFCTSCGAPIDGSAFCTNCGAAIESAPVAEPTPMPEPTPAPAPAPAPEPIPEPAPAAGPEFCTSCGAALSDGTAFCTMCGTPKGAAGAAPAPQPAPAPMPGPQPGAYTSPNPVAPEKKKSKAPMIIGIVVAVIVVLGVIGGLVSCLGGGGSDPKRDQAVDAITGTFDVDYRVYNNGNDSGWDYIFDGTATGTTSSNDSGTVTMTIDGDTYSFDWSYDAAETADDADGDLWYEITWRGNMSDLDGWAYYVVDQEIVYVYAYQDSDNKIIFTLENQR